MVPSPRSSDEPSTSTHFSCRVDTAAVYALVIHEVLWLVSSIGRPIIALSILQIHSEIAFVPILSRKLGSFG